MVARWDQPFAIKHLRAHLTEGFWASHEPATMEHPVETRARCDNFPQAGLLASATKILPVNPQLSPHSLINASRLVGTDPCRRKLVGGAAQSARLADRGMLRSEDSAIAQRQEGSGNRASNRVSQPYAAFIRSGRRRPHPRHWLAFANLVGAPCGSSL